MANSENIWAWSTTAANNDDADSAITWVEQQDPGTVNGSARAMMAATKRMANAQSGNVTVGGTADAITITTGQSIDSTHQALGFRICFKAAATNTGAVTVAVDGLSAVAVKRPSGDDLSPGDIASGGFYDIAFDGTNYKLLGTNVGAAAFSAHKNGSSQSVMGTIAATKVTFDTESIDAGSHFASSTWTPPSGRIMINAALAFSAVNTGSLTRIYLYKNGIAYKVLVTNAVVGVSLALPLIIDACSGTDTYEIYASATIENYTISGDSTLTYFQGTRF